MKELPVLDNIEDEWNTLAHILKQSATESLGTERRWYEKRDLRS